MTFAKHFLVELRLRRESVPQFERYPFNLPVVRGLERIRFHPQVTFFVGENATGKSTLLEAIAVALGLNPEGGTRNFNFSTRSSHSELHRHIRISKGVRKPVNSFFMRSESYFNLATEIEELDRGPLGPPIIDSYGGVPLHEQSHGEAFFACFRNRFGGGGLYILDEPEAALSPLRQVAFLKIMHDLLKKRSQFVIATHSPIILAYPDSKILECSDHGLREISWKESQAYSLTRQFLERPDEMLRELFEEDVE